MYSETWQARKPRPFPNLQNGIGTHSCRIGTESQLTHTWSYLTERSTWQRSLKAILWQTWVRQRWWQSLCSWAQDNGLATGRATKYVVPCLIPKQDEWEPDQFNQDMIALFPGFSAPECKHGNCEGEARNIIFTTVKQWLYSETC